jgi:hypothetical protein
LYSQLSILLKGYPNRIDYQVIDIHEFSPSQTFAHIKPGHCYYLNYVAPKMLIGIQTAVVAVLEQDVANMALIHLIPQNIAKSDHRMLPTGST